MNDQLRIIPGLKAAADISAKQHEAVQLNGTDWTVAAITANTQVPIGILQNDPSAAGQAAEVAGIGSICKARVGGVVNAGDVLGPDADGELVAKTPAAAGGSDFYSIAIALQDGAADQDLIFVLVTGPQWIETA